MTIDSNLTPTEAQQLLAVADSGIDHGDSVSTRSWLGAALSIGIGTLLGAFLLAGVYVLPVASWQLALAVSLGYGLGIGIAVTVYNLGRRVTPIGWMRRYRLGLTFSIGAFAIALALSFLTPERSLLLWIPLAVVVALPLGILGSLKVSR